MHFSLVIVQLAKNLGSTMNFLFVRFFVPVSQKKKIRMQNIVRNADNCLQIMQNIVCNSLVLDTLEN